MLLIGWKENNKHENFLNFGIDVARIFDQGAQSANHMQYDVIRKFYREGLLMGQKYLRIEDQKIDGPGLVRKQDVAKGGGLEP